MKDLALDVWHDLRQKRLLPVAIALGIAVIAVPLLMLEGEPEALKPPLAKQDSSSATAPVVNEDGSSLAGSSKLASFDRRDPFRSPARLRSLARLAESAQASAGGTASGLDVGRAGGAGDDLALGGEGPSGGDPMAASDGAGGGSSDPPANPDSGGSGSGRGGAGGGSGDPTPPPPDPRFFEYVAEVEFGPVGDEERYRDVRALDMLPREGNPVVVVYLGQTRANESAFLVNQAVRHGAQGQTSEGTCVPDRTDCNFVYLRTDNGQDDHYFTERGGDAREFHLRLIAVRRELDTRDVSALSRTTSTAARTGAEGPDSKRTVRRTAFDFRIPLIAGQRR